MEHISNLTSFEKLKSEWSESPTLTSDTFPVIPMTSTDFRFVIGFEMLSWSTNSRKVFCRWKIISTGLEIWDGSSARIAGGTRGLTPHFLSWFPTSRYKHCLTPTSKHPNHTNFWVGAVRLNPRPHYIQFENWMKALKLQLNMKKDILVSTKHNYFALFSLFGWFLGCSNLSRQKKYQSPSNIAV